MPPWTTCEKNNEIPDSLHTRMRAQYPIWQNKITSGAIINHLQNPMLHPILCSLCFTASFSPCGYPCQVSTALKWWLLNWLSPQLSTNSEHKLLVHFLLSKKYHGIGIVAFWVPLSLKGQVCQINCYFRSSAAIFRIYPYAHNLVSNPMSWDDGVTGLNRGRAFALQINAVNKMIDWM